MGLIIVISGVVMVMAAGSVMAISFMTRYKNPSEQELLEAGILEKTAGVGDVVFNYAEGPDNGPALLLLHAQTLDWFTYSKALPALSKEFHVFALDYPGHGKTRLPDRYPMSAGQIGNDVAHFIERVIGEPVYASGNSSGGLLTVWLAAHRPGLVKAIVLEDPPLFASEYPAIQQTVADKLFAASYRAVQDEQYGGNFLEYWIENGREFFRAYAGPFSQPLIKFLVRGYKKANPGKPVAIAFLPIVVQEMLRGLNYYDPRFGAAFHAGTWNEGFDHAEALAQIQCPAVLIHANFTIMEDGVLNGAMNQEQADRAVSLIPRGRYIKVDAGHVVNLEAPRRFVEIIEGHFLIP
jgi:pimeloyl-ACP methyl ester carboxylesterase